MRLKKINSDFLRLSIFKDGSAVVVKKLNNDEFLVVASDK